MCCLCVVSDLLVCYLCLLCEVCTRREWFMYLIRVLLPHAYCVFYCVVSMCVLCLLYYDNANHCGDTDGGEDSIEKVICCYDGNDSNNGNDDIDHYKNVGNSISFVCTAVDLIIVLRRQLFYILVYGSATLAFIRLSKIKLIKK